MFEISYNFRLSVKFSVHMINSTRDKIGFNCTNYFRSIVVLVLALAIALNKFHFRSLRNKMINLVLVIKYHFDFRLLFDINKKYIFQGFTEILLNNGTRNYMAKLCAQQDATAQDGRFYFLCNTLCSSIFDKLVRQS